MVTLTKHVIPGPDLHCSGPLALSGFLQHLSAKYKRRPKKVLLSERWALAVSQSEVYFVEKLQYRKSVIQQYSYILIN